MHRTARLLVLAVLTCLTATLPATFAPAAGAAAKGKRHAASTPKLRCPKGTTLQRDGKGRPRFCLSKNPSTAPRPDLDALAQAGLRLAPIKAPKGAKGPGASTRRANELLARAADPGQPLPGMVRRADLTDDLGEPTTQTSNADGTKESATWLDRDGVDATASRAYERAAEGQVGSSSEAVVNVRQHGAGGKEEGLFTDDRTSRCPTAAGVVDGSYGFGLVKGAGQFLHGKRTWQHVTVRMEGPVTGHVGMSAKAETFDVAISIVMEVRSWVEIAATRKVIKRAGTQTYRASLKGDHIPIDIPKADLLRLIGGSALRGPHGSVVKSQQELDLASKLIDHEIVALVSMKNQVQDGDKRWFDNRECAKIEAGSSPGELAPGDTATWDAGVRAADGTPVADAAWTAASTASGALSPTTARGPKARFAIAESGGEWDREAGRNAGLHAEALSPAGRTQPLDSTILAKEKPKPALYRFDVSVKYSEDMGDGIAPTAFKGSGMVQARTGAGFTDGAGSWDGTEWDGTPENPCGHDMMALRSVGGSALVGADVRDDGTATIAFTAEERPLQLAALAIVPLDQPSHTEIHEAGQPFCGTPGLAHERVEITVKVQKLAEG